VGNENNLFTIQNLHHSYENRTILSVPALRFCERTIHAITGPNGSGKTTLCSILALLLKPSSGAITFRNTLISYAGNTIDRLRRKITMVHQNPFLFTTTVEKNVTYGLRARNVSRPEAKQRAQACLELVGLEHVRRQQATKLSGGETQRVAIARALSIDPEVLILDEFTANVDRTYVEVLERVITEIFQDRNITIFVVTHNDRQASRIAHTHTRLVAGEVV